MTTELKNRIKNILESKYFKGFIYGLGIFLVLSFVFQAGMMAGYKRASFGQNFGNNYEKNFRGQKPDKRIMGDMVRNDLPNAHGAIGKIIRIDDSSFIVMDNKDKTEKVVIVDNKTEIRKVRSVGTVNDLKIDDYVVVIGSPNNLGQIVSKLIRIIPFPEGMSNNDNLDSNIKITPNTNGSLR